MKFPKIFISLFLSFAIIAGIGAPVLSAVATSENISDKVFRLHILANSDSTADQDVKLKLKNYVVDNIASYVSGDNLEQNIASANEHIDEITELCNAYLQSLGCKYRAKASVVKEFFKTRVYDDFTLPAGMYNSLKIEIGEGSGHNWWCIIFPSVCLSACTESIGDYLTSDELELVESSYTPKFKIVEIYESVKQRINAETE